MHDIALPFQSRAQPHFGQDSGSVSAVMSQLFLTHAVRIITQIHN